MTECVFIITTNHGIAFASLSADLAEKALTDYPTGCILAIELDRSRKAFIVSDTKEGFTSVQVDGNRGLDTPIKLSSSGESERFLLTADSLEDALNKSVNLFKRKK